MRLMNDEAQRALDLSLCCIWWHWPSEHIRGGQYIGGYDLALVWEDIHLRRPDAEIVDTQVFSPRWEAGGPPALPPLTQILSEKLF